MLAVVRAVAAGAAALKDLAQLLPRGAGKDAAVIEMLGFIAVIVHAVGVDPGGEPFPIVVRQLNAVMAGLQDLRQFRDLGTVGVRRTRNDVVGMIPAV